MSMEEDKALVASLVGRTIVEAKWYDQSPDDDWTGHEVCELTLDDGRVIEFGGYGYDAWGATVCEIATADTADATPSHDA